MWLKTLSSFIHETPLTEKTSFNAEPANGHEERRVFLISESGSLCELCVEIYLKQLPEMSNPPVIGNISLQEQRPHPNMRLRRPIYFVSLLSGFFKGVLERWRCRG